ncbi:hypothetical protein [Celeribacter sp.]|uniref:hypothetical protein n=1 Tax=Celeribacter sp. TaxID=1890673 RepID=UPI003A8E4A84
MTVLKFLRTLSACAPETCDLRRPVLSICLATGLAIGGVSVAQAAQPGSQQPGATIVISNDYGGSVRKRTAEVQQINRLGQSVEIRGSVCMSSCTMFLGAKSVCVMPETSFAFHGPYRFFSKLTSLEFDQWSRVIANHYPSFLRSWYMQTGRYRGSNPARVKGSELIRHGVAECR